MVPRRLRTKMLAFALLAAWSSCLAQAASPAAPKPRPRLDPTARGAEASPPRGSRNETAEAVTTMPKVTVRERAIPAEQPKPYVYDGPFSATRGGTIAEGEGKSARWRAGVMPALDLTLTDSGLRRRPEPRLNVEMLKVEF